MFDTYIEDKAMIPVLLGYDWMVSHGTWTDCPYETYMYLKKRSYTMATLNHWRSHNATHIHTRSVHISGRV